VLADEINRAPAKVQSALLEAMQERQVTIGDTTHPAEQPFLVHGDAEPHRAGGHLPAARGAARPLHADDQGRLPDREDERAIMDRMTSGITVRAEPVATPEEIAEARSVVGQVYIDEKIRDYIVNLVHATREPKAHGLGELADFIAFGASPRASIYLNLAARAHAFLRHRGYVTPEDIKAIGVDVLRHRVILTYEAEAEESPRDRHPQAVRARRSAVEPGTMSPRAAPEDPHHRDRHRAPGARSHGGSVPFGVQGQRHRLLRGAPVHARATTSGSSTGTCRRA
jgi:MoxR-like ATPase